MERQLCETHAGQILYNALEKLMKEQQMALEALRVGQMREADEATLKDLQGKYEKLLIQMRITIAEVQELKVSMGTRFIRHFTSNWN